MPDTDPSGVDLVSAFLRGQNLEQIGREDDAVTLYEEAVKAGFDSPGPYDRLIVIYSNRALHDDVTRVAAAALRNVHTHDEKRSWYERMQEEARARAENVPRAIPKQK